MFEHGGHYSKWNVRQRKTNAIWYHLYVEYKKYSELMNIAKKQTHRYRKKVVVTCGMGVGRSNIGVEEWEVYRYWV